MLANEEPIDMKVSSCSVCCARFLQQIRYWSLIRLWEVLSLSIDCLVLTMWSSLVAVTGGPLRGSLAVDSRPSLKSFAHFWTVLRDRASSPYALTRSEWISVFDFRKRVQNFTTILCSCIDDECDCFKRMKSVLSSFLRIFSLSACALWSLFMCLVCDSAAAGVVRWLFVYTALLSG